MAWTTIRQHSLRKYDEHTHCPRDERTSQMGENSFISPSFDETVTLVVSVAPDALPLFLMMCAKMYPVCGAWKHYWIDATINHHRQLLFLSFAGIIVVEGLVSDAHFTVVVLRVVCLFFRISHFYSPFLLCAIHFSIKNPNEKCHHAHTIHLLIVIEVTTVDTKATPCDMMCRRRYAHCEIRYMGNNKIEI